MFGPFWGRYGSSHSSEDDDHISSYREYNEVMSKEGIVQVLVRNAQNLQNVERFGYSDPHVLLDLEGKFRWRDHHYTNWNVGRVSSRNVRNVVPQCGIVLIQ